MAQTVPARQTVQNMTEGSPVSLILRFALPIFISQVFQQLYSTCLLYTSDAADEL